MVRKEKNKKTRDPGCTEAFNDHYEYEIASGRTCFLRFRFWTSRAQTLTQSKTGIHIHVHSRGKCTLKQGNKYNNNFFNKCAHLFPREDDYRGMNKNSKDIE